MVKGDSQSNQQERISTCPASVSDSVQETVSEPVSELVSELASEPVLELDISSKKARIVPELELSRAPSNGGKLRLVMEAMFSSMAKYSMEFLDVEDIYNLYCLTKVPVCTLEMLELVKAKRAKDEVPLFFESMVQCLERGYCRREWNAHRHVINVVRDSPTKVRLLFEAYVHATLEHDVERGIIRLSLDDLRMEVYVHLLPSRQRHIFSGRVVCGFDWYHWNPDGMISRFRVQREFPCSLIDTFYNVFGNLRERQHTMSCFDGAKQVACLDAPIRLDESDVWMIYVPEVPGRSDLEWRFMSTQGRLSDARVRQLFLGNPVGELHAVHASVATDESGALDDSAVIDDDIVAEYIGRPVDFGTGMGAR